eukprot:scaffold760_cov168-Amphora_coffeaeformis.AAC.4
MDPLLQAIRQLQSKNPKPDTAVALSTLHKRLQKIAKHPFESKYRVIEDNDHAYIQKIGRLKGAKDVLVHAGFVRNTPSSWELKASAEAWPRLMQSTALLSQAVREAEQLVQSTTSVATGKSSSSKSSLKTATTASTSDTSKSQDTTAAQKSSKKTQQPEKSEAALNAVAKLKAAELKTSKEKVATEQLSSQKKERPKTEKSAAVLSAAAKLKAAAQKAGQGKEDREQPSQPNQQQSPPKSALASSALAKLKAAALKTGKEKAANEQKSPQKEPQETSTQKPASPTSMMEKFKAAALKAGKEKADKEKQQKQLEQSTPQTSPPQNVAAASDLAKFKAAASAVGKQSQAQARQNPLKLAAQLAADDDDRSVRSDRSSVSLRDLALHNSAANLQNSSSNLKLSCSALSKIKAAAQQVHAQQQPQAAVKSSASNLSASPGGANKFKMAAQMALMQQRQQQSPVKDPRSRFHNAAQMALMQQQLQRAPPSNADPRSQFQNAAQLMMMQQQQQQQKAAPMDPRSRFQSIAQMAMMQQRQQQSPKMDPRSRFQNTAQMAMLQNSAKRRPNASWDGLSYPTSADSDDGLSYPTAAPEVARSSVPRSKSFDDGRPFILRTDSGRSLMSSSSNLGNAPPMPNSFALAPNGGSRRQLNPSASFRAQSSSRNMLNGSGSMRNIPQQQSLRGLNASGSLRNLPQQQSMRGGMMIQGTGPSRPQLMRENSLSLRDLQRGPGMVGVQPSQRHLMGGSAKGGMVSATPKGMASPEQPKEEEKKKTFCSSCGFVYTAVNLVTFGELTLDLVTTILSFIQLSEEFSCCGNKVDYGVLTLCVTIPYFFLVIVELLMLAYGIFSGGGGHEEKKHGSGKLENSDGFDDESTVTVSWQCSLSEALSWVVCINPFLGCLITWTLMYEVESKNEALLILGVEGAAIVLMFVTIYLERNEMSTCTMMVHLVPLVPFTVTCFVVWYYMERGGICFIVKENNFWFDGCELCSDGWPPDDKGFCPDGDIPIQSTYCGDNVDEQFCYYGY